MDKIYLCDIDGTIADHKGIRGPFEEHKVLLDKPLPTINLINSLLATGNRIIFFSGRSEKCREDTCKWLYRELDCGEYPELYMRQFKDMRSDDIVKEEMYNTHIKDKYEVIGVFDDRLKVCRMWYKLGLFVFNCNQGLIEF